MGWRWDNTGSAQRAPAITEADANNKAAISPRTWKPFSHLQNTQRDTMVRSLKETASSIGRWWERKATNLEEKEGQEQGNQMINYYLLPFRPMLDWNHGTKVPFPLATWPCSLLSVIHLFTAVAHTGSQSRVGSEQHPSSSSVPPRHGRAGTPSHGDNPPWTEMILQCLSIPGWNTISFRYILCFHLQVGFSVAFSWVVHYDKPQHLILSCVY